jgi:galactofuranose transport system ATP-binding protein
MRHIEKSFSGVKALDGVDFSVRKNEVHALMGENGAGKSTLIKILSGIYQKDSGEIFLDGKKIDHQTPIEAQNEGISTIYQELNLVPYLSIAENIFLGRQARRWGVIDWKKMIAEAERLFTERFGFSIDVSRPLEECSTAIYQLTAIARAISIRAKLIIMDEPTSSLDQKEVSILFRIISELKTKGISIILISHRLDEIFQVADAVTILRDGKLVDMKSMKDITKIELVTKMIGRNASEVLNYQKAHREVTGASVCGIEDVASGMRVKDVSLEIHKGEVVGLAGLLGSGRTELARTLFGIDGRNRGTITVKGKKVSYRSPREAIKDGLGFCTEDRKREGIFPEMSVGENLTAAVLPLISGGGLMNRHKIDEIVTRYIELLKIKTPGKNQLIKYLSGGNQQKVLLARWLCMHPELLILDEPTRGIDVGTKREIEEIIQQLAEQDIGILMISSEVDELVRGCDRVAVLSEGRKVEEFAQASITSQNLVTAMAQSHGMENR